MIKPDFTTDPAHNYLLTETLQTRYVIASHHLRECNHIIEIGGAQTPISNFITFKPKSVLVIDPLVKAYESDQLNGHPCDVRHLPKLVQECTIDTDRNNYGLVMLGFTVEMAKEKEEEVLTHIIKMINKARVTVIEHPPRYRPARKQVQYLLDRAMVNERLVVDLDFRQDKKSIRYNPTMDKKYLFRRFLVLEPKPKIVFGKH